VRHPHGLRAAAGKPVIGAAFGGGFFAGYISYTANSIPTHGLIVAPVASGYNGQNALQWKTSDTGSNDATSRFDGALNSANNNNSSHPAIFYCKGLNIGGYSDWYLPAEYELDIAYDNLKPTTTANSTSYGINPYSVPKRTVNRTAGAPAQTSSVAFQSGGAEAFITTGVPGGFHWSSTVIVDPMEASIIRFTDGLKISPDKTDFLYVRAFRKFAI
jgi:hypothetical protein